MKYSWRYRSALCTPAVAVNQYASNHQSGVDISLVDLEDSVRIADKAEARRLAEEFFTASTAVDKTCGIRINAITTPEGLRDLLALRQYAQKPELIMIPKVESPREIQIVQEILGSEFKNTKFMPVIETPIGLSRVEQIAGSTERIATVVFGCADYAYAVGAEMSWDYLLQARATIVNAARAADVDVMDGPCFDIHDENALRFEAQRARKLGFSGKAAVHPRQVPIITQEFSPTEQILDFARKADAADTIGGSAIAIVDGHMVGPPLLRASRRMLKDFKEKETDVYPEQKGATK